MTASTNFDYAIVGGGLQGCLLAHSLAHHRPNARVLLLERASELCGNHTWSFHASDVPEHSRVWLDPLVSHRWPGYRVKFPGLSRRVGIAYATITSTDLRSATSALADGSEGNKQRTPLTIQTGVTCDIESSTRVTLCDGHHVDCGVVIDCRGQASSAGAQGGAGYQSFVGYEYETDRAWPASEPTIMDVPTDQSDGFEFLYELPFGPRRVLLEYTRFSEQPACNQQRAEELIQKRLHEAGVSAAKQVRMEQGCLPMPYSAPSAKRRRWVAGGYAGGWNHAATGYSMPLAIRFADLVARTPIESLPSELAQVESSDTTRRHFARFLNRLLFCLVKPQHRWKIFRRFYSVLPEQRIERFYSHQFTVADAARIVVGRPPTGLAPLRFARSFVTRTGVVLP